MKNKVYDQTVRGVAEFLIDIEKTYNASVQLQNILVRSGKGSNYRSTFKDGGMKNISYRLNIIPDEEKAIVRLTINPRSYFFKMAYLPPHSASTITSFFYDFPQVVRDLSVDLNAYKKNPLEAEKMIDKEIAKLIEKEIQSVLTGKLLDNKKEWKLTTEGELNHSVTVSSFYQFN